MVNFGKLTTIASTILAGVAVPAFSASPAKPVVNDAERTKIESVVRDYILSHPEIIPEAMDNLRNRQMTKGIDANRQQIETPYAGAWAGNEKGTATLVIFFDYACHYCRQSQPDIERLLREDKQLKIVFRELPILGEDSNKAARASLVAAEKGKYLAFHDALYAAGSPAAANVEKVQKSLGLEVGSVEAAAQSPAIKAELDNNFALAQKLGVTGTPAWVIGNRVMSGAVGYEALKAAIAQARSSGAQ